MQFRVPQNLTIEDRIVGPFTALQFGILVIGGGLAFVVFSSSLPSPLNSILAFFITLFTALLAVGRFNGQPMYSFIRFFFIYLFTPKTRVWHKAGGEVRLVRPSNNRAVKERVHVAKKISRGDIASLAQLLDSRGKNGAVPSKPAPLGAKPPHPPS